MSRRFLALAITALMVVPIAWVTSPTAFAAGAFTDDDTSPHEADINRIAALEITKGCNPPQNTRYCPDKPVTRGQMATFLVRTFDIDGPKSSAFTDVGGSEHREDIASLAAAGITKGCNPPQNTRFCPDREVTRGEMAAFIVRGLGLDDLSRNEFDDARGHALEVEILRLAAAGITKGCNPPDNTLFCPDEPVTRGQMASFLVRTHDIIRTGTTTTSRPRPSTTTTTPPPGTGEGAFIESNGVVAMEIESNPLSSGWSRESQASGYQGSGYYIRSAQNDFSPGSGVLTYDLDVSDPGTYVFAIRSRRDKTASENIENGQRNDVFVRLDGGDWYKATTHNAFGEWGFIDKRRRNEGNTSSEFIPLAWNLSAGTHRFEISGRSNGIKIDRILAYLGDGDDLQRARSQRPADNTPESPRNG